MSAGSNWAGNYAYRAKSVVRPGTVGQLAELVARGTPLRALGSRHSFTDIADSAGELVSLENFDPAITIDRETRTVSVAAGVRYGELAQSLHAAGWALHNLASLPHISVAGAVATSTHGSGDSNGTLATAVRALEFVDGTGTEVRLERGDDDFEGAVVALGALGIVTRITLDIEPTFDVRQDVFTDLPWDTLLENFSAVTSSAYSVSVFTNWLGDTAGNAWLKSRVDAGGPPSTLFGAPRQHHDLHPLPDQAATNTTVQGGIPGPWSDRLAHFKLGYTPSNGNELQSEFLVPREHVVDALTGLRTLGDRIAPLLLISELRTMAADSLWLSGAFGRATVGIHFTWKMLPTEVYALLPEIEALLLELGGRPHWGKVFTASAAAIAPLYPRLDDFRELVKRHDPDRLFGNEYLQRTLGL
ncbi:xylitol oxidase [Glaciihabitans tibetensis]|uniref:Xylitol oxidase n=1 Tax=Glaciihabitans tibetensis TaxID=1266600 RepID=A0A2T0VIY1_9MICO|nr:D-arabinono-1,4-lactone oxidase [Glaciihabitans tibetensis]PRY70171.1 xylitol oxidase [Glaciihabitans tibetensis]